MGGRIPRRASVVCLWLVAVAPSLGDTASALADPAYHVTYLGFAFTNGIEASINNRGQIAGSDGYKSFIYDAGQITPLGTLGSPIPSRPTAINDSGQVAGFSLTASYEKHGFLFANGSLADLGALPGYPKSQAFDLNVVGDVVGASFSADGTSSHAFLYRNGKLTDLGPGTANAVNASGTIVGTTAEHRALRYENGTVIDFADSGDGLLVSATDINDSGQVVGSSAVPVAPNMALDHPFLYDKGVWRDLGLPVGVPLGIPSAINNLGQIVGNSNLSLGAYDRPPFLYTNGAIYNLQSLLDGSGAGLSLQLAYDINDSGAILAEGKLGPNYQAVLLTPVPEPASIMLAGIAVAWSLAKYRRRVSGR